MRSYTKQDKYERITSARSTLRFFSRFCWILCMDYTYMKCEPPLEVCMCTCKSKRNEAKTTKHYICLQWILVNVHIEIMLLLLFIIQFSFYFTSLRFFSIECIFIHFFLFFCALHTIERQTIKSIQQSSR